jgi:hypothetical protein
MDFPIINVSLQITSLNDSLKDCSWNYGNMVIPPNNSEIYSKDIETIFNGISIKFILDSKGVFNEITNFEEVKNGLENLLLKSGKLTTVDFNKTEYRNSIEAIRFTYNTPELIISSYFEELNILFSLFGEEIDIDSVNIDRLEIPEGIINGHHSGMAYTEIEEVDHPNMHIVQKRIFGKEFLIDFLKGISRKLPKRNDKLKEFENIENGEASILIKYYYNYVDKIMTKVESTKTIIYNQQKTHKTTIITLVK